MPSVRPAPVSLRSSASYDVSCAAWTMVFSFRVSRRRRDLHRGFRQLALHRAGGGGHWSTVAMQVNSFGKAGSFTFGATVAASRGARTLELCACPDPQAVVDGQVRVQQRGSAQAIRSTSRFQRS
jgi:hypothetical protein